MAKPDRLSDYLDNEPIIWKDTKRILGMPISFTHYSFDSNRLYVKKGLFNTSEDEVLLYRVLDISIKKTLWQKLFKVGTIHVDSADQTLPCFELKNIKNPDKVRKALSNIVEKERDEKRVLGKEMFGASGMMEGMDASFDADLHNGI